MNYKKILLLSLMLLLPVMLRAQEYWIDGIYYYIDSKKNAVVTSDPSGIKYSGSIVIPQQVTIGNDVYSVTTIGDYAFYGCSRLTSITIPESVTSIGEHAFRDCSGLTSVIIPESVTSIGYSAFYGCSGLTSVTIPESVTIIGSNAFYGCTGLTSVTIPESVTSIGSYAFCRCTGLTSVIIPESVTSIGEHAFRGCTGLTSVIIPESVTNIGTNAFYGCSNLNEAKVIVTDFSSFCNNHIMHSFFYGLTNSNISLIDAEGNEIKEFVIPEDVTSIGNYAFSKCSGLTSVTIPESVTSIGSSAFAGCKLEKVFAYNPLTKIASDSFSDRMFQHTMLYIPYGTWGQAIFEGDWYRFNNIREVTTTRQSLSQGRAYTMMNAQSFGYAVYNEYSDDINLVKAFYSVDEDDPNSSWQIIDRKDGKSVMNIGTKKYLIILANGELSLSEIPVTLKISDSDNGIKFNESEQEWMFVTNNRVQVNGETKVDTPEETLAGNSEYYSIDGKPLTKPVNGLNIIRTQDGTFRKEIK